MPKAPPTRPRLAADRMQTITTLVDSPYGAEHGADRVRRVVSTIETMHRRRQLDERQKMAADRYRWAYETCPSEIRCALNQDGLGGGGGSASRSPAENQMLAAAWLKDALRLLGIHDGKVVERVCGRGDTLQEIAEAMSPGKRPSKRQVELIGFRLRDGLTALADLWWPERHRMRSMMGEGARPSGASSGPIDREAIRAAHATRTRVFGYQEPEGD